MTFITILYMLHNIF